MPGLFPQPGFDGFVLRKVGFGALFGNTTGNTNIAIGSNALANTTASSNIGIGAQSLIANTVGFDNAATGVLALGANTTGSNPASRRRPARLSE